MSSTILQMMDSAPQTTEHTPQTMDPTPFQVTVKQLSQHFEERCLERLGTKLSVAKVAALCKKGVMMRHEEDGSSICAIVSVANGSFIGAYIPVLLDGTGITAITRSDPSSLKRFFKKPESKTPKKSACKSRGNLYDSDISTRNIISRIERDASLQAVVKAERRHLLKHDLAIRAGNAARRQEKAEQHDRKRGGKKNNNDGW
jgi:hypothetical protein